MDPVNPMVAIQTSANDLQASLITSSAAFDSIRHLFPLTLTPHLPSPQVKASGSHQSVDDAARHCLSVTNFLVNFTADLLSGKMPLELIQEAVARNMATDTPKDTAQPGNVGSSAVGAVDGSSIKATVGDESGLVGELEKPQPAPTAIATSSASDIVHNEVGIVTTTHHRAENALEKSQRSPLWRPRFWKAPAPPDIPPPSQPEVRLADASVVKTPQLPNTPDQLEHQSTAKNVVYGKSPHDGMTHNEAAKHYAALLSPPRSRRAAVATMGEGPLGPHGPALAPKGAVRPPTPANPTQNGVQPPSAIARPAATRTPAAKVENPTPRSRTRLIKSKNEPSKERLPLMPGMAAARKKGVAPTAPAAREAKPLRGQLPIGGRGKRAAPPAPLVLRSLAATAQPGVVLEVSPSTATNPAPTHTRPPATVGPLSPRTRIVSTGSRGRASLLGRPSTTLTEASTSSTQLDGENRKQPIMLRIKPLSNPTTASEVKPVIQKRRASTRLEQNAKRQKADDTA